MTRRILCVDDEENVVRALERTLRGIFEIETALGAEQALEKLAAGRYAVVMSDLRMPGMNGIEFLSEVKDLYPDAVRLILTGNADLTAAISAVNEGRIFQFLTKPCGPDNLRQALASALKQYELIIAERELLEETLNACVAGMVEVLSLTNPAAFGRTLRVRQYVAHMANKLVLPNSWQYDLAAMLSQLGCIAIPGEILEKINAGIAPSPEEQKTYHGHPAIGSSLLARIPRMKPIADMILHQMTSVAELDKGELRRETVLGAGMLGVAVFLEAAVSRGTPGQDAVAYMRARPTIYSQPLVAAIQSVELASVGREPKAVLLRDLQLDMVVNQDIWTRDGLFVMPKGQTVSTLIMARLKAFGKSRGIVEPISVLAPASQSELPRATGEAARRPEQHAVTHFNVSPADRLHAEPMNSSRSIPHSDGDGQLLSKGIA
jgi:response regulator RpfG family c-di-GMP phosphodiesterase